ncbi:MAG TPA: Ppx/GppA phosphatase family protein [Kiritimatiellia bacterium]|nr:Ppx/GppA phosphatase family protein [Kiritimatiellia bacterium]
MSTLPPPPPSDPAPVEPPRLYAVLDIGATAVRMEIAEIGSDGAIRTVETLRQSVHLGKDTFTLGRIQQSTIEDCVNILRGYRRVMKEYGVEEDRHIRAVATSSVREAANRDSFLDRIYIATKINIDIIEETEETRLTYLAVQDILTREPLLQKGDVLVVEVGGGDTELLHMHDGFVSFSNTYRLGALRMRETLESRGSSNQQMVDLFLRHIKLTVDQIKRNVPLQKASTLVAVSGDARFAAAEISSTWDHHNMVRIPTKAFAAFARQIGPLSIDDLVRDHHLSYQEAETLGPSLLAYAELAKAFRIQNIIVPKSSLRQGLLREVAIGNAWTPEFTEQVWHSALALGHKYAFDERHGTQVADLSVRLYHELQPEHLLPPRYELILRIAALLHEIGLFINNRSHHKHSMYAILNSDLFGMSRHDMLIIALIARYHRRAMPQPYHEGYATLDRDDRMVVAKLSAILRVADALDRNHMQQVREISYTRRPGQFTIYVHDVEDLFLERVALKEKGRLFDDVYGMRVSLETGTPTEGWLSDV